MPETPSLLPEGALPITYFTVILSNHQDQLTTAIATIFYSGTSYHTLFTEGGQPQFDLSEPQIHLVLDEDVQAAVSQGTLQIIDTLFDPDTN